jgi:hypothetical protein
MERAAFEQWRPREVARLLALVETERRYYQEMIAALPAALVVLAHDRTILSSNAAFRRLVGLRGEELRKRGIEQILPSDDLIERIRSAHVHADTAPFLIDMGERRFRIAAAPILGWEDETEPETLLLIQPVESVQPLEMAPPTESIQPPVETAGPAEAAPAPEASMDVSTLPAAIWQADAATLVFTYAGGAVQPILGYPAAHWLAEPQFFAERIHPEDRAEVMALYRSVVSAGGEASAEYRALPASGDPVWCRETIRVPAPGEGERGIAGVLSVIPQRRQLEAQAIAAARIDALRGLCSRLAHDLNNPLMIVTGYAEDLLNAFPAGDPARNDLAEILGAARRMADIAGQLLGFTRPQANAASRLELSKLIAALAKPGLGVDLQIESPEGAVWAMADVQQLTEAIAALVAFAIENTTDVSQLRVSCGSTRIAERMGTAATLQPGMYARLDIHAQGAAKDAPAGVFESILPAKDVNRPAGPAVARAYLNVRQWGGDVAFSSGAARGSTFTIYLPLAEPDRVATAPEPEIAAPAPEPPPVPSPPVEPSLGTVMVVEDEPGIRGLVRKILKRERFEVLEAGSGEEALAAASAYGGSIGLLLTDVVLPGMGGRELAESLVAAHADLKVVYVSGFTGDESIRTGKFPPGSIFLQKPFTLSALVSVVKKAFEL